MPRFTEPVKRVTSHRCDVGLEGRIGERSPGRLVSTEEHKAARGSPSLRSLANAGRIVHAERYVGKGDS